MRILAYSPHPMINLRDPAGSTIRTRAMIEAFEQLGHKVDRVIMGDITYEQGGSVVGQETAKRTGRIKTLIPPFVWQTARDFMLMRYDQQAKKELDAAIHQHHPDLIYETVHYLQPSGVDLAKKYGIPHIAELNGSFPDERILLGGKSLHVSKLWPKGYQVEKHQLQETDLIVVVSRMIQETFQNRYSIPDEKFAISPNGIHLDRLKVDLQLKRQLTEKYKLADALVVGFVGSIFPYHGVDLLIEGFAEVLKQNPHSNLRLLIVGGGESLSDLQARAQSLAISEKVIFTDRVPHDEVFTYLDLMDITALAKTEPYMSPIKLFEYGAMEKAVIAPNQPGVRDVMVDGEDGLLVSPSREALASALSKLVLDPKLRAKLGAQFGQKVKSTYSWRHTAENIMKEWGHGRVRNA
jgi:glycosyltransferase involved in cell wall biosynthesis